MQLSGLPGRPPGRHLVLAWTWLLATGLAMTGESSAQDLCARPIGHVVAAEGRVTIHRSAGKRHDVVRGRTTPFCQGDTLVTSDRSRAALAVSPETHIRVDQNTRLALTGGDGETEVELMRERATIDAKPGGAYFMTRFPKRFKVRTRFVNATVEGTEFVVGLAAANAEIAVLEGRVLAEDTGANTMPRRVFAGQSTVSGSSSITQVVRPADRVQWALHYPRLSRPSEPRDCPAPGASRVCRIEAIEALLSVGRADEAEALFAAGSADDADLLALRSIVATVRSDRVQASSFARRAVSAAPDSLRALLAVGYAAQAESDIPGALEAARTAVAAHPTDALARARLSELLLAAGEVEKAEQEGSAAVAADSASGRPLLARGFARLASGRTTEAEADFDAALDRDSTDPQAWLGRAIALVRRGLLSAGRDDLATAVSLDPANALLRSYLGKVYFDERSSARDALAGDQFALARQLDPNDPTPWYYDAIRKQIGNRPGEALADLEEARTRNDNRSVYRSRLLLDQDQAARSASKARVYSDLGFDQLAVATAARSLSTDPDNFSAHRFLAESYALRPRHEAARVSELLQSQLRQPVNATPLLTQQSEANLLVPFTGGPMAASSHEFNPLFLRDRATLSLSGFGGSQNTKGSEVSAGWLHGSTAVSAGAYNIDTNGFRPGADLRQEIYRLFVQHDVSASTSFQAEVRTARLDHGDIKLRFDPASAPAEYRRGLDTNTLRLGARHAFSASSDVIGSFILQRREEAVIDRIIDTQDPLMPVEVALRQRLATDAGVAEAQYSHRWNAVSIKAGAGLYLDRTVDRGTFDVTDATFQFPIFNEVIDGRPRVQHRNVYLYSHLPLGDRARLVAGLTAEHFERNGIFERNRIHPKLGAVYEPFDGTVFRAVALRGMKRPLAGNQSIEPTEVAGFNQFFDDANGATFTRYGIAVDQRLGATLAAGLELSTRSLSTPETLGSTTIFNPWRERLHRAYISWLPTPTLSLGLEHYIDRQSRQVPPGTTNNSFIQSLDSHLMPVTATWHDPSGFFLRLRATQVRQDVRFASATAGTTGGADVFWLADAQFGYRLAPGRAAISVQLFNLFDREFRFQNTDLVGDPRPPLFAPGRSLMVRLSLTL